MLDAIQIRMLGAFEARRADGQPIAPPGRRSVALLACLALPDDRTGSRVRIAEMLWHDRGPEQASGSLRQELLRLRRAFGERIALPGGDAPVSAPRLDPEAIDIDILRFQEAAAEPSRASEAIGLYRGPLLEGFPMPEGGAFPAWLAHHRQRLHALAVTVLLRLLRGAEASEAVAQRLIALDPACEEAHRHVIRAQAGRGDLARAHAAYQACEAALHRQTGAGPSQETRALMALVEAELSRSSVTMFGIMHGAPGGRTDWVRALREDADMLRLPEPRSLPIIEDRPSIAVLPFSDLSVDPRTPGDRFADGLTEETTNALSRIAGFFVTSRHSAMVYRDAAVDARLIAAQLGVRYLVEGSVERQDAGTRGHVRLIDGRTGLHLWADSVSAPPGRALELRDRLVEQIAGRLQPRLLMTELRRAIEQAPPQADAWGWFLRAQSSLTTQRPLPEVLDASAEALEQALVMDPHYAMAHAMLAAIHTWRSVSRTRGGGLRGRLMARLSMTRALRLEPENPFVLSACSEAALYAAGDIDWAAALLERALRRDANDANALAMLANVRRMAGDDPRGGLTLLDQAMRLSPRDPRSAFWHLHAAWCHWKLGDHAAMEAEARRSLLLYGSGPWSWVCLTSALGLQARWDEAAAAGAILRELMPGFSGRKFYWTARFFYGRRFEGHTKQDYATLQRVLDRALDARSR